MATKILHATRERNGIHLLVHLDTVMTVGSHEAHELSLPEGAPHPHFVRKYFWPHRTPGVHQTFEVPATEDTPAVMRDMTDAEYLEMIESDARQKAALDLEGIRFYQPTPPPHEKIAELHGKEL